MCCVLRGPVLVVRVPGAAENVDGHGEEVVVNEAGIDSESAHQEDHVATAVERVEDLNVSLT